MSDHAAWLTVNETNHFPNLDELGEMTQIKESWESLRLGIGL